ncbi:MAG: peptidylprolyl isomerase [Candidatus Zixiibacteriota bacterium]
MMKIMRKLTKQILWVVIAAFVGTIIFAWGMEFSAKSKKKGMIATINGENIDAVAFQQLYDQALRQAEKDRGDIDEQTSYQIREEVWNNMVNQVLLNQEAQKRGIQVTDVELYEYLRRFPPKELQENTAFKTADGKFDYQKYLQALNDPRVPWKQVEDFVRPNLRLAKLQQSIMTLTHVTDDEIKDFYGDENDRVKVKYLLVPSYQLQKDIPPISDEEVNRYYQEHRDEFKIDQTADLSYVFFEKKASPADEEAAKKRILDIRNDILQGEDFGEIAKENSDDNGSAKNGGDLGWFGKGMMVPAFEQAAFSLKVGEVSEPVKTQFGWHLIKVTDKRTEGEKEEVKASHILLKVAPSEETSAQIKEAADGFAEEISKSDLSQKAAEHKYSVSETGWFVPGGNIQGLGQNPQVTDFAFASEAGKTSDAIETAKGFYVFQIKGKRSAGVAPLEEAKSGIKQNLLKIKADDLALSKAGNIFAEVKAGKSLQKAAEENNATYAEPDEFARGTTVPQIGKIPEFIGAAFSLNLPGQVSAPVKTSLGAFIIQLVSRSAPGDSAFVAVKDSLTWVVLQKKQSQLFQDWFTQIRKHADIKDYRSEFYRESGSY